MKLNIDEQIKSIFISHAKDKEISISSVSNALQNISVITYLQKKTELNDVDSSEDSFLSIFEICLANISLSSSNKIQGSLNQKQVRGVLQILQICAYHLSNSNTVINVSKIVLKLIDWLQASEHNFHSDIAKIFNCLISSHQLFINKAVIHKFYGLCDKAYAGKIHLSFYNSLERIKFLSNTDGFKMYFVIDKIIESLLVSKSNLDKIYCGSVLYVLRWFSFNVFTSRSLHVLILNKLHNISAFLIKNWDLFSRSISHSNENIMIMQESSVKYLFNPSVINDHNLCLKKFLPLYPKYDLPNSYKLPLFNQFGIYYNLLQNNCDLFDTDCSQSQIILLWIHYTTYFHEYPTQMSDDLTGYLFKFCCCQLSSVCSRLKYLSKNQSSYDILNSHWLIFLLMASCLKYSFKRQLKMRTFFLQNFSLEIEKPAICHLLEQIFHKGIKGMYKAFIWPLMSCLMLLLSKKEFESNINLILKILDVFSADASNEMGLEFYLLAVCTFLSAIKDHLLDYDVLTLMMNCTSLLKSYSLKYGVAQKPVLLNNAGNKCLMTEQLFFLVFYFFGDYIVRYSVTCPIKLTCWNKELDKVYATLIEKCKHSPSSIRLWHLYSLLQLDFKLYSVKRQINFSTSEILNCKLYSLHFLWNVVQNTSEVKINEVFSICLFWIIYYSESIFEYIFNSHKRKQNLYKDVNNLILESSCLQIVKDFEVNSMTISIVCIYIFFFSVTDYQCDISSALVSDFIQSMFSLKTSSCDGRKRFKSNFTFSDFKVAIINCLAEYPFSRWLKSDFCDFASLIEFSVEHNSTWSFNESAIILDDELRIDFDDSVVNDPFENDSSTLDVKSVCGRHIKEYKRSIMNKLTTLKVVVRYAVQYEDDAIFKLIISTILSFGENRRMKPCHLLSDIDWLSSFIDLLITECSNKTVCHNSLIQIMFLSVNCLKESFKIAFFKNSLLMVDKLLVILHKLSDLHNIYFIDVLKNKFVDYIENCRALGDNIHKLNSTAALALMTQLERDELTHISTFHINLFILIGKVWLNTMVETMQVDQPKTHKFMLACIDLDFVNNSCKVEVFAFYINHLLNGVRKSSSNSPFVYAVFEQFTSRLKQPIVFQQINAGIQHFQELLEIDKSQVFYIKSMIENIAKSKYKGLDLVAEAFSVSFIWSNFRPEDSFDLKNNLRVIFCNECEVKWKELIEMVIDIVLLNYASLNKECDLSTINYELFDFEYINDIMLTYPDKFLHLFLSLPKSEAHIKIFLKNENMLIHPALNKVQALALHLSSNRQITQGKLQSIALSRDQLLSVFKSYENILSISRIFVFKTSALSDLLCKLFACLILDDWTTIDTDSKQKICKLWFTQYLAVDDLRLLLVGFFQLACEFFHSEALSVLLTEDTTIKARYSAWTHIITFISMYLLPHLNTHDKAFGLYYVLCGFSDIFDDYFKRLKNKECDLNLFLCLLNDFIEVCETMDIISKSIHEENEINLIVKPLAFVHRILVELSVYVISNDLESVQLVKTSNICIKKIIRLTKFHVLQVPINKHLIKLRYPLLQIHKQFKICKFLDDCNKFDVPDTISVIKSFCSQSNIFIFSRSLDYQSWILYYIAEELHRLSKTETDFISLNSDAILTQLVHLLNSIIMPNTFLSEILSINDGDTKLSALYCLNKIKHIVEQGLLHKELTVNSLLEKSQFNPLLCEKLTCVLICLQISCRPTFVKSTDAIKSLRLMCSNKSNALSHLLSNLHDTVGKEMWNKKFKIIFSSLASFGLCIGNKKHDNGGTNSSRSKQITMRSVEKLNQHFSSLKTDADLFSVFDWFKQNNFIYDDLLISMCPLISKYHYFAHLIMPWLMVEYFSKTQVLLKQVDERNLTFIFSQICECLISSKSKLMKKMLLKTVILVHKVNQYYKKLYQPTILFEVAVKWLKISELFLTDYQCTDSALLAFEMYWLTESTSENPQIFLSVEPMKVWLGLCDATNDKYGLVASNLLAVEYQNDEVLGLLDNVKLDNDKINLGIKECRNKYNWKLRQWNHEIFSDICSEKTVKNENLIEFLYASSFAVNESDLETFDEILSNMVNSMLSKVKGNHKLFQSDIIHPLSVLTHVHKVVLVEGNNLLGDLMSLLRISGMNKNLNVTIFDWAMNIHESVKGDVYDRVIKMFEFKEQICPTGEIEYMLSRDEIKNFSDDIDSIFVELKQKSYLAEKELSVNNIKISCLMQRACWSKVKQFLQGYDVSGDICDAKFKKITKLTNFFVSLTKHLTECLHMNYLAEEKEIISTYAEPTFDSLNCIKQKYSEQNFDCGEVIKSISQCLNIIAKFSDLRYQNIVDYMKSNEYMRRQKLLKEAELDVRCLGALGEKSQIQRLLEKQWAFENKELDTLLEEAHVYVKMAVKSYSMCLAQSNDYDLCIYRIIYLWLFSNTEMETIKSDLVSSVNEIVKNHVKFIAPCKFLSIFPQILVRLNSHAKDENDLQEVLKNLIIRIVEENTFESIYTLLSQVHANMDDLVIKSNSYFNDAKFSIKRQGQNDTGEQTLRSQSILKIFEEVLSRKSKDVSDQLDTIRNLCLSFIELANIDVECHRGSAGPFQMDVYWSLYKLNESKKLRYIQIPTVSSRSHGSKCLIHSYDKTYCLAGGLNLPKIISCLGSDGRKRRQVVKGRDDPRQDAVMQQIFQTANLLLSNYKQSDSFSSAGAHFENLYVNTYKVIPLSMRSGILEWCEETKPLGDWLASDKKLNGHVRYHPGDMTPNQAKQILAGVRDKPPSKRLPTYNIISSKLKPVFGYFFVEYFPDPSSWTVAKRSYTKSLAVSSILGYVVGLGDRHPQNILIYLFSGELVHIDLGIAFDQGKLLPTPEMVPFRMTRDLVHALGPFGLQASFKPCAELTYSVLCRYQNIISTLLQVLLHDPLYSWCLSPSQLCALEAKRAELITQRRSLPINTDVKVSSTSRKESINQMAERAVLNVKRKLQNVKLLSLTEEDSITGSDMSGRIEKLLSEATSPENLSKMYFGWQPYL